MSKIAAIIGRFLLALVFIVSGSLKFADIAGTEETMQAVGIPGGFAILAAAIELVAGLCLAAGFMVRLVSLVLIAFTAMVILFFHNQINQPAQAAEALKNVALIGGLFLAFAHSQMWGRFTSLSRSSREAEIASKAESERHEAEVRAVRAEARAEALAEGRPHEPTLAPAMEPSSSKKGAAARRRWFDW